MRFGKVNQPKSKKRLFQTLEYLTGNPGWSLKSPNISSENYGRKSCIYIWCDTHLQKKKLESKLHQHGHRVNKNYMTSGTGVEVEVTYFKGADRVD